MHTSQVLKSVNIMSFLMGLLETRPHKSLIEKCSCQQVNFKHTANSQQHIDRIGEFHWAITDWEKR